MLLGANPKACTVGELKVTSLGDPDRYRCSCGELIKQCGFWLAVSDCMAERGLDFEPTRAGTSIRAVESSYARRLLNPLHRGRALEALRDAALSLSPTWTALLKDTQIRNACLVEALCALTGADVIVDSSKTGLRLKYLLRNPDLDVRIVRLTRDGRGVALTHKDPMTFADAQDPSLRAGGCGGHRDSERKSMAEAAREWRRSNEEAECVLSGVPRSKWIQVRYEDLCADPCTVLRAVFGFLGLPTDPIVLDFRSVAQHVIGNGMRLDSRSDICLDERWKTHLTEDDLRVFEQVAGKLNRSLGYV